MNKSLLATAAILGALSVALGAFGAHALKAKLSPDGLATFETGVKYQFYHVFALIAVAFAAQYLPDSNLLNWAGNLFLAGIIIFCGSLYVLTAFRAAGNENMNWLGAITPIGGLCFIAGWILFAIAVIKK